jgi:hypothetical protein
MQNPKAKDEHGSNTDLQDQIPESVLHPRSSVAVLWFGWALWLRLLALTGIFVLVFYGYGPALHHPPREDHWPFLVDTINDDQFIPMVLETYSYNRSRKIGPGDYLLFRPVLFVFMSAEKALFGPRYVYWHLAGIIIHSAIVGVFLSLLLRLGRIYPASSPGMALLREVFASVLALFFAVNFAGTEMVIWCHIQGYMIYTLCVLGGMRLLVDELEKGTLPFVKLISAFLLLLVAAFAYEVGSVIAVCVGVVLGLSAAWRGEVRRGLLRFGLFASILPIFVVTERLDRLAHPEAKRDITETSVLEHVHWPQTVEHAGRYLLFTLGQPFFPTCAEWGFEDRIVLPEPNQNSQAYQRLDPVSVVSYGVVMTGTGLALLAVWRIARDQCARRGSLFLIIAASLILLHMAIIVLGRMNMRPVSGILAFNSYYAYAPLLALLVLLYFLWVRAEIPDLKSQIPNKFQIPSTKSETRASSVWSIGALGIRICLRFGISNLGFRSLLLVGLVVLSLVSVYKVREMTQHIRAFYRPLRTEMATVQKLIDEHGHEPNFAISFDPDTYYSLRCYHGLPRVHILFARYIDHTHPTHVICGKNGSFVTMREEDYQQEHGPRYQSLPTFIEPGGDGYMVFRYLDRYYGLNFEEGCFRADRQDYRNLLQGNSVAEVLIQIHNATRRTESHADSP